MTKADTNGHWNAKVDLDQNEIQTILIALTENLSDAHCYNCGQNQTELIERFIEIDDNLSLRDKFKLD